MLRVVEAYQSVLYAQREIDVAQHEQETASALLDFGRMITSKLVWRSSRTGCRLR